jgi:hypothetical protein
LSELTDKPGDELRESSSLSTGGWTALIAGMTGILGIVSGYALYVLWWDQTEKPESPWAFGAALLAAALMSFAFEILRGAIQGEEKPWSEPRVAVTVVMLAAFELFIIAVHGAAEQIQDLGKVANFIFGEQFADHVGTTGNVIALGMLWIWVALMIMVKLRKFITGWPYPNSNLHPNDSPRGYLGAVGPDVWRGARAGFTAGVFWGSLAAIGYVFLFRALFLSQWIHTHYDDWADQLATSMRGLPGLVAIGPLLAGLFAKYGGAWGLLAGLAVATFILRFMLPKEDRDVATLLPGISFVILFVILSGSAVFTQQGAWRDLVSLAYLSAMIWGVPATLLGALAPFLRRPAHNPSVWGLVAMAAAAVMSVVTGATLFAEDTTGIEKLLLMAVTLSLFYVAFVLFRGNWAEEYWLLVALSIGTIVWGTTSLMQKANLLDMQKSARSLIALPLGVPSPSSALLDAIATLRVPKTVSKTEFSVTYDDEVKGSLPSGVNRMLFNINPCLEESGWSAAQRMEFTTKLQMQTKSNGEETHSEQSDISDHSAKHADYEESEKQVVAENMQGVPNLDPKTGQKLSASAQFGEITDRIGRFNSLNDKANALEQWVNANPVVLYLDVSSTIPSACRLDSDSDTALAGVRSSFGDLYAAQFAVTESKARIRATLVSDVADLTAAQTKLEASQEVLQKEEARRLELVMTSSMGFWVTIGLLAIWRLTDRQPD